MGPYDIINLIQNETGWNLKLESLGENYIECIPAGYPKAHSFSLVLRKTPIRVSAQISLGNFAKELMVAIERTDKEKKNIFFHAIEVMNQDLINTRIQCGDYQGPAIDMKSWPSSWDNFSLIISYIYDEGEDSNKLLCMIGNKILSVLTIILPVKIIEGSGYLEGSSFEYMQTYYERNKKNRDLAFKYHGRQCKVCNFKNEEVFGETSRDIIEVHHTTPISLLGESYKLDIQKDLVPLCPNCHAFVHTKKPPFTIQEAIEKLKDGRKK